MLRCQHDYSRKSDNLQVGGKSYSHLGRIKYTALSLYVSFRLLTSKICKKVNKTIWLKNKKIFGTPNPKVILSRSGKWWVPKFLTRKWFKWSFNRINGKYVNRAGIVHTVTRFWLQITEFISWYGKTEEKKNHFFPLWQDCWTKLFSF